MRNSLITFYPLLYPLLLCLSTCPDKISQQSHSYTPDHTAERRERVPGRERLTARAIKAKHALVAAGLWIGVVGLRGLWNFVRTVMMVFWNGSVLPDARYMCLPELRMLQ